MRHTWILFCSASMFFALANGGKMFTSLNAWYKVACIAENIKVSCNSTHSILPVPLILSISQDSDHYICDKHGNVVCLPGWSNEKNFCRDPICYPKCVLGQGNCTKPVTCECEIGWTGIDCGSCICLPGCVHGFCNLPFECTCEPGWTGMFCDKRK